MNKYILLFRGINVGGKNKLPMKALKHLLEENGYKNVQTYIQSGNVVLQSETRPNVEHLSSEVEQQFGFLPKIMMLDRAEFDFAFNNNPYPLQEGKTVHFYFCEESPLLNMEKIERYKATSERYQVIEKVFYLHAPDGIGRSKLVAKIEACLGVSATGRNLNTVNKLFEMLQR
ncbi:MAG TPA: DUF1697 domain-containing protein [Campylobacterales bacterium]|nr:DUF1697 domain-containing protein [Campylobacterales bacterium]